MRREHTPVPECLSIQLPPLIRVPTIFEFVQEREYLADADPKIGLIDPNSGLFNIPRHEQGFVNRGTGSPAWRCKVTLPQQVLYSPYDALNQYAK